MSNIKERTSHIVSKHPGSHKKLEEHYYRTRQSGEEIARRTQKRERERRKRKR